jgi:hypothetical protein
MLGYVAVEQASSRGMYGHIPTLWSSQVFTHQLTKEPFMIMAIAARGPPELGRDPSNFN